MSATIDLMEATRQCPLIVQEGESLNVTGQLVDFAGVPIPKAGLSSFEVTLHDEATKAIINSIERQDRLGGSRQRWIVHAQIRRRRQCCLGLSAVP